ncbi:hypothetical protein BJX62DRAFT_251806 [Aspergillus germanicus]
MAAPGHNLPASAPARPDGWPRITESSPRCAALHNELLARAVTGRGPRAPSDEVANSLHPSLIEFLKRAWDEAVLPHWSILFLYLRALKNPDDLQDRMDSYEEKGEDGRFIKLYETSHFRLGDDEGILFDQTTLKAMFVEDYNDTAIITTREYSWMPLEVILDSYLQMIDEEKVEDQWIIHHYTKTNLERATTAFKRLVDVIESRTPHTSDSTTLMNLPWHDPATISNQDILPPFSFAHKFLKAISNYKVRFRYIAPGVRFPTVAEFQDQPITDFFTLPHNHHGQHPGDCPLRIFQIDTPEQQPVAYDDDFGLHNIAAGFYFHPVVQHWPLFWSNGCRLLLPFGIVGSRWARQSNGEPFGLVWYQDKDPKPCDTHGDLYQGGTINGITNTHLVQIDKEVDEDGVAGGIDKFREADTEAHWEKYWIPPSW